jgi:hypothetical protein
LISSKAYSQRAIIDDKKDTSIAFTINQSKFLLKKINNLDLCDSLLKISETQIKQYDSISVSKDIQISLLKKYIANEKEINELCNSKIIILESEINNQMKLVKKQKMYKVVGILAGVVSTSFMTYLYIKK